MHHFVYIARCGDGSLYTGTCVDLEERAATHNAGKGAKYTRSRLPVAFVYHERCASLSAARRREAEVKRLPRAAKLALVRAKRKRSRLQKRAIARKPRRS